MKKYTVPTMQVVKLQTQSILEVSSYNSVLGDKGQLSKQINFADIEEFNLNVEEDEEDF